PWSGLPGVGEAQLRVDREHVRVHVGVSGPDEARVRPLREDALEHHRLEPEADAMPAVRRGDRGALLLDDVWIERVEFDLGETDALTGCLVDREKEPPDHPGLFEEALALPDLLLGQLPVVERDLATGHVVDAFGGLDERLHQLVGHGLVDLLEPIALRDGPGDRKSTRLNYSH